MLDPTDAPYLVLISPEKIKKDASFCRARISLLKQTQRIAKELQRYRENASFHVEAQGRFFVFSCLRAFGWGLLCVGVSGFFVSWCVVFLRHLALRHVGKGMLASLLEKTHFSKRECSRWVAKGFLYKRGGDVVGEGDVQLWFVLHGALDGK